MDKNIEIRHLPINIRQALAEILNNSWKKLMEAIPKDLIGYSIEDNYERKYNTEQISTIERVSGATPEILPITILFEEWGSSGKSRPTIGQLFKLLVDVQLFRGADYIAETLFKEATPQRPTAGPAASIDIPIINSDEILPEMEETESPRRQEIIIDNITPQIVLPPLHLVSHSSTNPNLLSNGTELFNQNYIGMDEKEYSKFCKVQVQAETRSPVPSVRTNETSNRVPSSYSNTEETNLTPSPRLSNPFLASDSVYEKSNKGNPSQQEHQTLENLNNQDNQPIFELPLLSKIGMSGSVPIGANDYSTTYTRSERTSSQSFELPNLVPLTINSSQSVEQQVSPIPAFSGLLSLNQSLNKIPDFSALQRSVEFHSTDNQSLSISDIQLMRNSSDLYSNSKRFPSNVQIFDLNQIIAATDNFNNNRFETNIMDGRKLGTGGFSDVYLAVNLSREIQYSAIKRLKKNHEKYIEKFYLEVNILSQYTHKNLVKLLGCGISNNEYCLVFEYIRGGNLNEKLTKCRDKMESLIWKERIAIAKGISEGINFLHGVNIIHRDIKSSNILLDLHNVPKICDFGLIRSETSTVTTNASGTTPYMAPETIRGSDATRSVDIYAFGVVLLELITGLKVLDSSRTESDLVTYFEIQLKNLNFIQILTDKNSGDWGYQKYSIELLIKIYELIKNCISPTYKDRPEISLVKTKLNDLINNYCL